MQQHLFANTLKGSYDVISCFPLSLECYMLLRIYKICKVAKIKVSNSKRYYLSKLRVCQAFLKRLIQTCPHMSTSRCGKICITPPKRIRNERRRIILAVVLFLPPPCPGDTVCFIVKVKVHCLAFQMSTQLEISGYAIFTTLFQNSTT